jgi:glycosyltransferase involved in cell wall biosynthesis
MGIHVVVVDDNPHLRWEGRVHPANAAFQRFAAAVLDVPGRPVASLTSCVPLRDAEAAPASLPLDPRIRVVGTAPFDGIAGFLGSLPAMLRANRPILRGAIAGADLVWLKVPGSNAPLAAAIANRRGAPRFGWVAGRAADVGGARYDGVAAVGARLVGAAYDAAGVMAALGGDRVVVGADLVDRDGRPGPGLAASLVEPDEIRDTEGRPWPAIPWRLRIGWAGRLAPGKGVEALLEATAILVARHGDRPRTELVLLGAGPLEAEVREQVRAHGLGERVHLVGFVGERAAYLDAIAACDVVVSPSEAEGFPKVVLDAMAAGLPVLAVPAGRLRPLAEVAIVGRLGASPEAIAAGLEGLIGDPGRAVALRRAGVRFVAAHTRPAEATRLVERWQRRWPELTWR